MFQKLIKKALCGFFLLVCMNGPSYAVNEQGSVMKVVAKAAVDGGGEVVKRTLFIVRHPAAAAQNAFYASRTIVGGVVTAVGGTVETVWGYLVEETPEVEGEGRDGIEGSVKSYTYTAIKEATESVVDGTTELLVTSYEENAEPVAYSVNANIDFGGTFSDMVSSFVMQLYDWAVGTLPESEL